MAALSAADNGDPGADPPFFILSTSFGRISAAIEASSGIIKGLYNPVTNNCASRIVEVSNLLGYSSSSSGFDQLTAYLVDRFLEFGFGQILLDDPRSLAVLSDVSLTERGVGLDQRVLDVVSSVRTRAHIFCFVSFDSGGRSASGKDDYRAS